MQKEETIKTSLKILTEDIIKMIENKNIKISRQMKYNILNLKNKIPINTFIELEKHLNKTTDIIRYYEILNYYYTKWEIYKYYTHAHAQKI